MSEGEMSLPPRSIFITDRGRVFFQGLEQCGHAILKLPRFTHFLDLCWFSSKTLLFTILPRMAFEMCCPDPSMVLWPPHFKMICMYIQENRKSFARDFYCGENRRRWTAMTEKKKEVESEANLTPKSSELPLYSDTLWPYVIWITLYLINKI